VKALSSDALSPIEMIRQRLELTETAEGQWEARCPAHDDNRPSLSVTVLTKSGIVGVYCHAGCEPGDIVGALGLTLADLFPTRIEDSPSSKRARPQIEATYDYCDAAGELVFQSVRMIPKDFRQRRPKPDSDGKWLWSVKGCPVIPYRLPDLHAADPLSPVFIVEGEKDVDRLRNLGFIATCNAGGAGKWKADHAAFLAGRVVVILPDNDDPGRKHATQVAMSLRGVAASIKVVELPELPPKGDVSDWLNAGGDAATLTAIVETTAEWQPSDSDVSAAGRDLPEVQLPGGEQTISDASAALGKLFAAKQTHFMRGESIFRVAGDENGHHRLIRVCPAGFASDCEQVASLVKMVQGGEGPELKPAICSEPTARSILTSQAFRIELPPLRVLSRCPVLVDRDGQLVEVVGYDRPSGIYASGESPELVGLDDAKRLLHEAISGFRFATPADRSRAMAALITPALVAGGLLQGRAPIDLGEADQSQTGKGYRNKITAAIYNHTPVAISQQRAGVGSLEESFDCALIAGKTFIALDNVRGKVDSQKIESFLTEDTYFARAAYHSNTEIDPRRVYVMFTSNKADMTTDLANRSSCVRILKQPDGFHYPSFPEGDILQRIRARQPLYLGAVFAVVKAWHAAGRPRTTETRHDFRAWAQSLDWIVQNLLSCDPLLDGHRETQRRMTNPAMNWLRDVALAAIAQNREGEWLIAADLIDIIDADGGIDLPGLRDGCDLEDERARKSALQHTGRRLKQCFGQQDRIELDQLVIDRECTIDEGRHERRRYRICQKVPLETAADGRSGIANISGGAHENLFDEDFRETRTAVAADSAADAPLTVPLMISRDAADAVDVLNNKYMRGRTHEPLIDVLCIHQRHQRHSGDSDTSDAAAAGGTGTRETIIL